MADPDLRERVRGRLRELFAPMVAEEDVDQFARQIENSIHTRWHDRAYRAAAKSFMCCMDEGVARSEMCVDFLREMNDQNWAAAVEASFKLFAKL